MSGFNNFIAGIQSGQHAKQSRDLNNARQQHATVQTQHAQQKMDAGHRKELTDFLGGAASFIRKQPVQHREHALKSYWDAMKANPSYYEKLNESGFLADLSDNTLDGFLESIRSERVLKNGEAIVGRNNQVVVSNRPHTVHAHGDNLQAFDPATGRFGATQTRGQTFDERETVRSNLANENLKDYSNHTARIEAETDAQEPGSYGKNVVYAQDRDGNTLAYQLNDRGESKQLDLGDGITPLSPQQTAQQREYGKGLGKRELGRTKAGLALQQAQAKMTRIKNKVSLAIEQSTRGNTGRIQGGITLSQRAANLNATLETIKANVGFKELQDMRDSSPTGGALGQVTEREIAFLQALIANLDRKQSESQLDLNLQEITDEIEASYARIEQAYMQDYANGLFGGNNTTRSQVALGGNDSAPPPPPGFEVD